MKEKQLRCSWLAPHELRGILQKYNVKIKIGGKTLHSGFTSTTRYNRKLDFIANRGQIYKVTVRALTHTVGSPASTLLKFINSGAPNLIFIILPSIFLLYFFIIELFDI